MNKGLMLFKILKLFFILKIDSENIKLSKIDRIL